MRIVVQKGHCVTLKSNSFHHEKSPSEEEEKFIEDSKEAMTKIYDETYTLSALCRAQRSDLIVYGLKLKAEGKELEKTIYDTETLNVITQFWNKHKARLVLNEQNILVYRRTSEEKVSFGYDAIVLPQLCQAEVIFRAYD